jgi:poly-D-alanine transfer protein DltD
MKNNNLQPAAKIAATKTWFSNNVLADFSINFIHLESLEWIDVQMLIKRFNMNQISRATSLELHDDKAHS